MRNATTLTCMLVVHGLFSAGPLLAETVDVRLQNGRNISAAIHPRTDEERLWLQYGTGTVTVIRPVAWESIAGVSHRGEEITVPQLKALATHLETPTPAPAVASPRVLRVPPADASAGGQTMADRARQALGFTPRIRSVQFDAALANWDGDVETDGLHLRLFPINDQGAVAPAAGTLQVEFVARRQRSYDDVPTRRGVVLDTIGRWTVQIDEADFADGFATVKLPFQAVHPEFDSTWFTGGLVHVRFSVAGDGTFEQSLDGIRVRPFAPLRDALEIQTGRRFFSTERTGRGQRVNSQPR